MLQYLTMDSSYEHEGNTLGTNNREQLPPRPELEALPEAVRAYVEWLETERRSLQEQARSLAMEAYVDSLTGLWKADIFDEFLQQEWKRLQRADFGAEQPAAFSLLYIDVDDFKQVNDTWGHAIGDRYLERIGQLLAENKRDNDLACRLSGDEFALALPDTDSDGARTVAEKLQVARQQPLQSGGHDIAISFSIGIASHRFGDSPEEVRQRADAALYQAKSVENKGIIAQEK